MSVNYPHIFFITAGEEGNGTLVHCDCDRWQSSDPPPRIPAPGKHISKIWEIPMQPSQSLSIRFDIRDQRISPEFPCPLEILHRASISDVVLGCPFLKSHVLCCSCYIRRPDKDVQMMVDEQNHGDGPARLGA